MSSAVLHITIAENKNLISEPQDVDDRDGSPNGLWLFVR